MSTELQKNLANEIVKNVSRKKPKNKKELVVSSGYSEITADRHATEVIRQKGVQEELESMGFTEYKAKRVVADIMNNTEAGDNDRLKAADMALKVFGSYAPEKNLNINIDNKPAEANIQALAEKVAEELKEQKIHGSNKQNETVSVVQGQN